MRSVQKEVAAMTFVDEANESLGIATKAGATRSNRVFLWLQWHLPRAVKLNDGDLDHPSRSLLFDVAVSSP